MSSSNALICPACSARLLSGKLSADQVILCASCGIQFRSGGDWPVTRTSRKAIASLTLGIISMGVTGVPAFLLGLSIASLTLGIISMGVAGVPAFLLGLWARSDIARQQHAEILTGKWLATVGTSLGGLFSLVMFVLPLALVIPMARTEAREREVSELSERALAHGRDDDWTNAAAEYAKILERDPADEMNWLRAAPLYVNSGDDEAYRHLCEDMLTRFGDTNTPHVAERVAKACLLVPFSEEILIPASRLAEMSATQDPRDWAILYSHVTHGLAQYRLGQYAAAIEACENCQSGDPTGEVWFRAADAYLVKAMAYFRLGQEAEANAALDQARGIVNSHPLELESSWHDELICRILLDEAEAMIDQNLR